MVETQTPAPPYKVIFVKVGRDDPSRGQQFNLRPVKVYEHNIQEAIDHDREALQLNDYRTWLEGRLKELDPSFVPPEPKTPLPWRGAGSVKAAAGA